jgi:competence protein ComEA
MEELQRPLPPRSAVDRLRAWIEWFGYGRIIGSAVATVIVCAGAYWLVRVPPPPTEASLPLATTSVATPAAPEQGATSASGQDSPTDTAGPGTASAPPILVVHVAGAVVAAGVYELPGGSRVEGALAAAGGVGPDADPNALNLAAPLVDGSRVYVPRVGEEVPTPLVVGGAATPTGVDVPDVVDVNRATAAELESLPGVGPATALAIVAERDGNGPFIDVDDLDRVPGIGPAKIETLRELVTT